MVPAHLFLGLGPGGRLVLIWRAPWAYGTMFSLPALVPPVAGTLAFVYVLKPGIGPVNTLLKKIGIEGPGWFTDPSWSKPSLTLLALWGIGNTMVIFLAALLDVPVQLHEAAAIDGANAWQRFRHVTLPTLSPVLVFTTITSVIYTLQYFTQAAVAAGAASGQVTAGGNSKSNNFGLPQGPTFTYPPRMYLQGFPDGHLGYANALAVLLFVASFSVIAIVLRRAKSFHGEVS